MILPNLRRVTHAEFVWCNTTGQYRDEKPKEDTHLGKYISPEHKLHLIALKYTLDQWRPVLTLHMGNGKVLTFENERALKLWESYKGVVFNNK